MNDRDEMLRNALKDCLQKENEEVPSDSEIKKQYTPSDKFKKYMLHLIRLEKNKEKYKIVYEHRSSIYKFVAGAALIIISINIGVTLLLPKTNSDNLVNENMVAESTSDTADMAATESSAAKSTTDSTLETTTELPSDSITDIAEKSATDNETELLWTADLTEENEAVLRIENNTEEPYTYTNILKVEKYENDMWTTIYSMEQVDEKVLNPGESIEESIKLSDYEIKKDGSYILYRNINNEMVTVNIETIQ